MAFASDAVETAQTIPVSSSRPVGAEELAPPVSMMQAMADLHSRDTIAAERAQQVLDRANLTAEQRRFADLLRHPESDRRVELLELLERTEDRGSRRAILEFLKTSDPDEAVRTEAARQFSLQTIETSTPPTGSEASHDRTISLTAFESTSRLTRPVKEPVRSEIERKYLIDQTPADPEQSIELLEKRATYRRFNQAPIREEVTDEEVVDLQSVGPNEYRIYAKQLGVSVISFWFENPEAPGQPDVLSYLVRVLDDPEEDERMRVLLRNLEQDLNRTFPNSSVQLSYVGQQVVIRGQAKDVEAATHISRIVSQSLPDDEQAEQAFDPEQVFLGNAGVQDLVDAGGIRGLLTGQNSAGINAANINGRVINLLQISGVHQVMLKVTVAEVNRSATRAIGVDFSLGSIGDSASFFSMLPLAQLGTIGNGATLLADRTDFDLAINALKTLNLARTLATPTLTTLNGQQAQMLVGGSFPVPQVTGATATGLQGVTFQQFGVQMSFLPTVTDNDRVRLKVQATVSTRDESTGTMVGNSNVSGLTSRNFQTTVELRNGTTLAVGGLIQSNLGGTTSRIPFAGDVPFLGRAFSSDTTSYDEQELIVLVTPYLVGPVEGGPEMLPLPGSDYFEPDDFEFFLQGRLEGRRAEDFRSPARSDLGRIKAFRKLEQQYFIGQPGHSNAVFVPR
jgi:pilus assembly protein CpaC